MIYHSKGRGASRSRSLRALVYAGLLVLAPGVTPALSQIAGQVVITDLSSPVRLVAPVGDARLFVAEQAGLIKVFDRDGTSRGIFLDLTALTDANGERGLLGLAFPPNYLSSGRLYVHYVDASGNACIVRYNVDPANRDQALPGSAQPVITVGGFGPYHRGGHLEFGPDGMLYVGLGDGGSSSNSQDGSVLLGKVLRLDVSGTTGYVVPAGNPFVGLPPRDEIWVSGLRNPWCWSFDRTTGDLYIADVGHGQREEVDILPAASPGGANYGWPFMEGFACYSPPQDCNDGSLTLPVYDYDHSASRCSMSGGYVYRGGAVPGLAGHYFFGDYCTGQVWSLIWTPGGGLGPVTEWTDSLGTGGGTTTISAFGQDGFGELYVVEIYPGRVRRIVSSISAAGDVPPVAHLEQNFPNPFNPRTTIPFVMPAGGGRATLQLYDLAGRRVRTLVDEVLAEGGHEAVWSGTDERGLAVPAGSYLYRLECNGLTETRKLTLLE